MISAKIIADSHNEAGDRLTTMEVTFPRYMLAQFNKHRIISSNSASSRAIPISKRVKMAQENPYIPTHWGRNQPGMVAGEEIDPEQQRWAVKKWLEARDCAVAKALAIDGLGVHKEICNRILEPFLWTTVIATATEWQNLFNLRLKPDAQPDFQATAHAMKVALESSAPVLVSDGGWHLPYVDEDLPLKVARKVSVGRCARISYLTHDGKRDIDADIKLGERLLKNMHLTPAEHVATPDDYYMEYQGNPLTGWVSERKLMGY